MKYLNTILFLSFINQKAMAKQISTEILIEASPEKVWAILTNFKDYPKWNPFIKSISGIPIAGHKITARIEPPGSGGMTFKPRVIVFEPNKEFRWQGHLLVPGLFDGMHRFLIRDNSDGTCTLIQSESFKGILIPLFKKMIENNTIQGFQLMNRKLKELAEYQTD